VVASTSTPLTTSRRQPSKAQTILSPARIERHNDWIEAFFDSIGQTEKTRDDQGATALMSTTDIANPEIAIARLFALNQARAGPG
jgi:hypothetical protein